jgi:outer membrane protein insertion porin family
VLLLQFTLSLASVLSLLEHCSISYGIFAKKTEGAELEVEEYKVNEKGGSVGYGIPITKDTRIGVNLGLHSF